MYLKFIDTTENIKKIINKKTGELEIRLINEKCGNASGLIGFGDDTWRKRGFSSLHDIVTIIGYYATGQLYLAPLRLFDSCPRRAFGPAVPSWFASNQQG